MIRTRSSTYDLQGPVKIRVFRNEDKFFNHLKKHFLSPAEPWARFFGEDKIARWRKIKDGGPVLMVEEAYRRIFSLIDSGIKFSAKKPIYIGLKGSQKFKDGNSRKIQGYHFLAKEGFIVTVVDGVVRTAYFVGTRPDESTYTYFRKGWERLSWKASQHSYRDHEAGINYFNLISEKISSANWADCPNFGSADTVQGATSGERKKEVKYSLLADALQKAIEKAAGKQQVLS